MSIRRITCCLLTREPVMRLLMLHQRLIVPASELPELQQRCYSDKSKDGCNDKKKELDCMNKPKPKKKKDDKGCVDYKPDPCNPDDDDVPKRKKPKTLPCASRIERKRNLMKNKDANDSKDSKESDPCAQSKQQKSKEDAERKAELKAREDKCKKE